MADLSTTKNFDFQNIQSLWGGYISSFDKTNIASNIYVGGSQNIYKKLNGNLAVRQGQKRRGVANDTISPISSSFIWNTSWGATYTAVISNSTLYIVANDIWYVLQSSLTKTRYVFDKWWDNTAKQDNLLFVNGTDNLYMWTGGFGFVSSTTANTIVLDRTVALSFLDPASGGVVINGNSYSYTGSAGSTLTGVTPDPTGEANGSAVLQSIYISSATPSAGAANDFLKVINNQVYIGSYTSRLIYISDDTSFTNYTVPSPRAAGDPELLTLDGVGQGIGVRQGKAHIGFGNGSWAVVTFTDITVGSTLTQQTTVDVKPVAIGQAPYAHEFIDTVGDSLVYLAQDQQVRSFGDFNNLFTPGYPSFSQEIATELMAETFTGGSLTCIGEFTYVTAPNSGRVYLYQVRNRVDPNGNVVAERLWHSPFVWNLTKVDDLNGTTIGFSNANPQIYDLWDTNQWFDDSPSDEQLPYECILAFSYRTNNRRQGLQSFDKVFTEGYITTGTPLMLTVNYNYLGAESILQQYVNSVAYPATVFSLSVDSLGDHSLGVASLGSGGDETETQTPSKFKVINQFSLVNCFEYQLVYSSNSTNAQWEILAQGTNADVEKEQNAGFLINKQ